MDFSLHQSSYHRLKKFNYNIWDKTSIIIYHTWILNKIPPISEEIRMTLILLKACFSSTYVATYTYLATVQVPSRELYNCYKAQQVPTWCKLLIEPFVRTWAHKNLPTSPYKLHIIVKEYKKVWEYDVPNLNTHTSVNLEKSVRIWVLVHEVPALP